MTRRVCLIWVLAFAILAAGSQTGLKGQSASSISPDEVIWGEVRLSSQSIGFYHETTKRDGDQVTSTVDLEYAIGREGSKVEIKSHATYVQAPDGRLQAVHAESSTSKTPTTIDVTVSGQSLQIRSTSGGKSYDSTLAFTGELLGPEGARQLIVSDLGCDKKTFSYQSFEPEFAAVKTITTTCVGTEEINGANQPAHKFTQTIEGFPLQQTLWTDNEGRLLRLGAETPFGEMVTARTEQDPRNALAHGSTTQPADRYDATLVLSNILVPHARRVQEMTIRITQTKSELGWPDFASPEQTVLEETVDHVVLRTKQAPLPKAADKPGAPPADLQSYLAANSLLQSDDNLVMKEAQEATRGHAPGLDSALALQKWTADNMHADMGIAIVPASEVAHDRHGTCMGYSILLASLARAVHIPSRIRMGYVYDHGIWGGHAWTELYIGGAWLPLDAAEYFPGPSDAARFSAIVTGAENGVIGNIGEFAKITGGIKVTILNYTVDGKAVTVPENAPAFHIVSDTYENPWLGLRLQRPPSMSFFDMDSHWPDDTVVGIKDGRDSLKVSYQIVSSNRDWQDQAKRYVADQDAAGELKRTLWHGMPARRFSAAGKAVLTIDDGDTAWYLLAAGPDADRLLADVSAHMQLADAHGAQEPHLAGAAGASGIP